MTEWAAKVLADVPRYDLDPMPPIGTMDQEVYGEWVRFDDALAAIDRMGREMALDVLASSGQAAEAYAAQLAAEAERAALRAKVARLEGVLTNLPAVYAHQINTGVREVYDPLQRFYTMESVLIAIAEAQK